MSGQDEPNPVRDWLPSGKLTWHFLTCLDYPLHPTKKHFLESHEINPLLTKVVRSRCLPPPTAVGVQIGTSELDAGGNHVMD